MSFNAQDRELLRGCLLLQLDAAKPLSIDLNELRDNAQAAYFDVNEEVIMTAMSLMERNGWVIRYTHPLSPEVRRWKLTEAGKLIVEQLYG
jgi:DNA-binding HxlR family transcriptional regulator